MKIAKKYIVIGFCGLSLLIFSIPISPASFNCPPGVPSGCGLMVNTILLFGGVGYLKSEIENKILPGLEVNVQLDSGEFRKAKLTHKAIVGRKVESGETVLLNCKKAYPSVMKPGAKVCQLEFTGFDPYSPCVKGSDCYGKVPSWGIEVESDGTPDPELMKFK